MDEYISKRAAINMVCSKCTVDTPDSCSTIQRGDDWCEEMYYLLKTPAADVVPVVHGEWEHDGHHIRCNRYGTVICRTDREGDTIPKNFYPNCGASMNGRREDDTIKLNLKHGNVVSPKGHSVKNSFYMPKGVEQTGCYIGVYFGDSSVFRVARSVDEHKGRGD